MQAELAILFAGEFAPFASFADTLVIDSSRSAMPGRDYVSFANMNDHLIRFAPQWWHADRRALVSEWSRYYLMRLVVPVVAAQMLLERALPIGFDDVGIIDSEDGTPRQFVLRGLGECRPEEMGAARFLPLIDGYLAPLFDALCMYAPLSSRVLWSNAGNGLEWAVTTWARHPQVSPVALHDAQTLLKTETLPDGRKNPFYQPVRYIDVGETEPWRQRRLCCIRYCLPGEELCSNCPCRKAPHPLS
ncbi:siderophore-iron reductase FhuF [Phytohalomonas tamaricis]|uniref:siderophore-iron reductase FhuF n=1 Tax=Phytohalomonas tamaricis TaxID=2081032 RepID=UPI000D0BC613|nr:siderophore-iron reductase FhuF [Phytohalomonas tamaricis]